MVSSYFTTTWTCRQHFPTTILFLPEDPRERKSGWRGVFQRERLPRSLDSTLHATVLIFAAVQCEWGESAIRAGPRLPRRPADCRGAGNETNRHALEPMTSLADVRATVGGHVIKGDDLKGPHGIHCFAKGKI